MFIFYFLSFQNILAIIFSILIHSDKGYGLRESISLKFVEICVSFHRCSHVFMKIK